MIVCVPGRRRRSATEFAGFGLRLLLVKARGDPQGNARVFAADAAKRRLEISAGAAPLARKGGARMVFEKVKAILAEQLDIDENTIEPSSLIVDDLGADSLDIVDLVMTLEDEFDAEIPDEAIETMKTVGDVVRFIEEHQEG